ncbi:unnamed protein product [Rhodiola kirilowii]
MSFGLCNAPGTFQWVVTSIFSDMRIEVDKAKVDVIMTLPYPATVRNIKSFLGYAGFYRRFIQDFSKKALPLSKLLQKDDHFEFTAACREAFDELKRALTSTPIIRAPDWTQPFEIMCDASDYAVGTVLGPTDGQETCGYLLRLKDLRCRPRKLLHH